MIMQIVHWPMSRVTRGKCHWQDLQSLVYPELYWYLSACFLCSMDVEHFGKKKKRKKKKVIAIYNSSQGKKKFDSWKETLLFNFNLGVVFTHWGQIWSCTGLSAWTNSFYILRASLGQYHSTYILIAMHMIPSSIYPWSQKTHNN